MPWLRYRFPRGRLRSTPVRDSGQAVASTIAVRESQRGAIAGGDSNVRRRYHRVGVQIPSSAACQNDIGRDHDPKCVVADKGDLDEHPDDRKAHHNERERKSILHYTSPTRRNKSNKRFRDSRCKTRLHLRFAFARPRSRLQRQDDSTREHGRGDLGGFRIKGPPIRRASATATSAGRFSPTQPIQSRDCRTSYRVAAVRSGHRAYIKRGGAPSEVQPAICFRDGAAREHIAARGLIYGLDIAHTACGKRGAAQSAATRAASKCRRCAGRLGKVQQCS
jgi:hypothetical protein